MADYKTAHTQEQIQEHLDANGGLALVDFYADWCGPCRVIDPYLKQAAKNNGVLLIKVNVQDAPELASKFEVVALPTFFVINNKFNNILFKTIGGNKPKVDQSIKFIQNSRLKK